MIYAILLRDFAVSQEKRLNPALANTQLILIDAGKYRPKVISPDSLARQMGVKPGSFLREAQSLCPAAVFLPVEEARYRRLFLELGLKLLEISPRIEPEYQASSACFYTDDEQMLPLLMETIQKETDIRVQIGSASNKFAARVAAAVAQSEARCQVLEKAEASFLAPYSVSILPLDREMKRRLPLLGIETMGALAALPRLSIWEQFGKRGKWVHELASGIDPRPLSPLKVPLRVVVQKCIEDGCSDRFALYQILESLSLSLFQQLGEQETGQVTLLLSQTAGTVLELQRQPSPALREHLSLLRLLRQMLDVLPVRAPVIEIQVQLEQIKSRQAVQLSLFAEKKAVKNIQDYLPEWVARHRLADFYRLRIHPQAFADEKLEKQKISSL